MTCKGICTRYRAANSWDAKSHYISGHKRCQICQIFVESEGLRCPCCRNRLRTKPRNKKYKDRYNNQVYKRQ